MSSVGRQRVRCREIGESARDLVVRRGSRGGVFGVTGVPSDSNPTLASCRLHPFSYETMY